MLVTNTLHIDTSPTIAWRVTEDLVRWPEWTPTVTSLSRLDAGPVGVGTRARLKQPGIREAEWTVTEFVPGARFVWETRRPGVRIRGIHEIAPTPSGVTSTLGVEASGFGAAILWPLLFFPIRRSLSLENRALKARCEELARAHHDESA